MNWMQRAMARKYEGSEEGFTLVELLVVILILGILSAIVVLSISGFQKTGDKQACVTSLRTVESASAAYYADNNSTWPTTIGQLTGGNYLKTAPKASYGITVDGAGNASSTLAGCT